MDKTTPHPLFKLATELGPLMVFFVANAKFHLFVATGAFMVAVVAAIPKASRAESQQANLDALNVGLDDEDIKAIASLPKDQRCVNPGFAPAWD